MNAFEKIIIKEVAKNLKNRESSKYHVKYTSWQWETQVLRLIIYHHNQLDYSMVEFNFRQNYLEATASFSQTSM